MRNVRFQCFTQTSLIGTLLQIIMKRLPTCSFIDPFLIPKNLQLSTRWFSNMWTWDNCLQCSCVLISVIIMLQLGLMPIDRILYMVIMCDVIVIQWLQIQRKNVTSLKILTGPLFMHSSRNKHVSYLLILCLIPLSEPMVATPLICPSFSIHFQPHPFSSHCSSFYFSTYLILNTSVVCATRIELLTKFKNDKLTCTQWLMILW